MRKRHTLREPSPFTAALGVIFHHADREPMLKLLDEWGAHLNLLAKLEPGCDEAWKEFNASERAKAKLTIYLKRYGLTWDKVEEAVRVIQRSQ